MSDFDYDLFVIGGGSGGVRAARMSAQYGARVALAEESRFGGTCVIRGCVPKKLMVYASSFREAFEDSEGFGWSVSGAAFDWAKMRAARDAEVDRLEGLYKANLERVGVKTIRQHARLTGPQSVVLADGAAITAKTVLVAVGGRPNALPIEGGEHAIVSDDIFKLDTLPKSILIIGGGYIAVEFAGVFNGLGSRVTLTNRSPGVLRGFDHDLRALLEHEMRGKGMDLRLGCAPRKIEDIDGRKRVTYDNGDVIEADVVLSAVGRSPHTLGLGLDEAGVMTGEGGVITVDTSSRTNIPSIYAVGDVTGRAELTPVAIREGAAVAETVFNDNPTQPDHELIPTAVFTQPEIGTIGMTEEAARAAGEIEVYRAHFRPMLHTLSGREEKMLMKVLVDKATRKVLGVHIMGHGAGEMIQCAGIAVKMGATKEDFDRTMAVHPTAAEELVTMRDPVA